MKRNDGDEKLIEQTVERDYTAGCPSATQLSSNDFYFKKSMARMIPDSGLVSETGSRYAEPNIYWGLAKQLSDDFIVIHSIPWLSAVAKQIDNHPVPTGEKIKGYFLETRSYRPDYRFRQIYLAAKSIALKSASESLKRGLSSLRHQKGANRYADHSNRS